VSVPPAELVVSVDPVASVEPVLSSDDANVTVGAVPTLPEAVSSLPETKVTPSLWPGSCSSRSRIWSTVVAFVMSDPSG
jgi:hypothetical protein